MQQGDNNRPMKTEATALLVFPVRDPGNEIHVGSGDQLGLEPELVSKVEAEEYWDWKVVGDEGGSVPVTLEEDTPVGK